MSAVTSVGKVSEKNGMPFCSSFNMSLERNKCKVHWFMRLLVEDITTNKSIHLTVYNEMLASLCQADNLAALTTQEFTCKILEIDPLLITENTIQKKVTHVSKLIPNSDEKLYDT